MPEEQRGGEWLEGYADHEAWLIAKYGITILRGEGRPSIPMGSLSVETLKNALQDTYAAGRHSVLEHPLYHRPAPIVDDLQFTSAGTIKDGKAAYIPVHPDEAKAALQPEPAFERTLPPGCVPQPDLLDIYVAEWCLAVQQAEYVTDILEQQYHGQDRATLANLGMLTYAKTCIENLTITLQNFLEVKKAAIDPADKKFASMVDRFNRGQ